MLDSKVFRQVEIDLKALGLDSDFTPVTAHPRVEVKISLRTLMSLIAQAQENQLSVPACGGCGHSHEVTFYRLAGKLVAYCFECVPAGVQER